MANRMIFCVKLFVFSYIIFCAQRHSFALKVLRVQSYSIDKPSSLNDISVIELESRERREAVNNDTTTQSAGQQTTEATSLRPPRPTATTDGPQRPAPTSPRPPFPEDWNVQHGDHRYYKSYTFVAPNLNDFWIDLDSPQNHDALSNSHRTAVTAPLKFPFPFYGHMINNVTIATGGFLYMSPFIHKFLTATQYIAPLMANFDTKTGGDQSTILYKDFGTKFIVEWKDVHLQDQVESGSFHFQTVLHNNGSIHFVYKKLPVKVSNISSKLHPVKIGLSDAFYFDTKSFGVNRRTIYEYHRVTVNQTYIEEGTIVVMDPLPTCNKATDCETCISQQIGFKCKWCGIVHRCSDGVDWHRQEWLNSDCLKYAAINNCSEILNATTTAINLTVSDTTTTMNLTAPDTSIVITLCGPAGSANCSQIPTTGAPRRSSGPSGTIAVVVVVIVIIVVLIGALVGWFYYAYTHPTSASGMWLIEHRPSQMKAKLNTMKFWKKGGTAGDKYAVESTA